MKNICIIIVAATLSCCNTTNTTTQSNSVSNPPALSPFTRAVLDCNRSTALLTFRCAYNHPLKSQYSMEEQERVAYFVMMYEKAAKGEISEAEAKYATTAYMNKMQAEKDAITRQNAAIAQSNAVIAAQQQAQSAAALGQMGTALMIAGQPRPAVIYPAPQQNFPRQTTCTGMSNVVNCMNY